MKKAHIFTLDVLIAFVILILGISIIYYAYPVKNKVYYNTERISEDIISVLVETRITDLCAKPGESLSAGCHCTNYKKLENLVCDESLKDKNANILSLFTELIEKGAADGDEVEEVIWQIFVEKNVIDEKRFGFALIYTTPQSTGAPLELYHSDTAAVHNLN